ncbi:MAG TPA: peptidoglycan-associated lipoprotein Pal [Thermoanaerobaculia bacterium]|jgi:peptidoglycan-associated lipoprotein|nr:peptidoglycan-associated lipoprotein Pal [Thermoanaerobaculia bacterium]HQR68395.1 peptidoglycan-associated lipoprotein Pal [Thermoanaerobaculia bacterium]
MSRFVRTFGPIALAALLAGAAACSKKPPVQTTPEPTPTPAPVVAAPTPVPVPAKPAKPPESPEVKVTDRTLVEISGYLKPAFFDYDKADIRPDAREALGADAEFLRKWPTLKVTIEGHCDERGTREYNMALGQRRAGSARDFLVSLGVDASRLQIISYGKERPFCTDRTEDCWQKNRRAHFVVTAK